ncbi:MAG: alpha/beta hydrolase [Pyrinomonadaceae bacterium]|nr:alpha/beta hydrolase [Pyrinomonadaceae bacterium]
MFFIVALMGSIHSITAQNPNGMTAKPDAQMQQVLDNLGKLKPIPIETLSAGEARYQPAFVDAYKYTIQQKQNGRYPQPEPVGKVDDIMISGAAGEIPARVYTPSGNGPFPVIVYYHGGGWVIASINAYDSSARALTNGAGAIVVAVEYRKGPESRFPAAHDDSFAAYQWTLANAASLGGDAKRIAVVGESAGGNLACNVAILARDRKVQTPLAQVLVYPIANNDLNAPSVRENTSSMLTLNSQKIPWFLENYLNSKSESGDPRIALVKANLRGLPPTTIINAQIDPLRSEGELLAQTMRTAGVKVEQTTYPNVAHEFFGMAAVIDKAKAAQAQAFKALRTAFGN